MNRIINSTLKRITVRSLLLTAFIISLAMQPFTASAAGGATQIPVLWTVGGLSAGLDSAGQAARIATDAFGNVAVVSGPSGGRDLAVTSYTADGILRWRRTVSPGVGHVRRRLGGRCAQRRFCRDRAQPRLSRPSDRQHHGPLQLRRDAPVAGGLLRRDSSLQLGGSWSTPRVTNTSPGARPETAFSCRSTALPVPCFGRRGTRPAAATPSPPRWR